MIRFRISNPASYENLNMASKVTEENFSSDSESKSVGELFDEGFKIYNELEDDDKQSQDDVKKCIQHFENATRMVSEVGIFGKNEAVEEMSTSDLKFFLLPYLLAQLNMKVNQMKRLEAIETAEVYYRDFIKRCHSYGITEVEVENAKEKENGEIEEVKKILPVSLHQSARNRNEKIRRYKEQKELDEQLKSLHDYETRGDEDITRSYYLTLIKRYIFNAVDDLELFIIEKGILLHMAKQDTSKPDFKPSEKPKPLKTVIITRDAVQKQVYGIGYPSLPVLSVEEFYDQRIREGIFPDPDARPTKKVPEPSSDDEREKVDDEQELQKARDFDEWKDDHRRGEGNRYNRS